MFTGIVEELGSVVAVEPLPGEAARLVVSGPLVTGDAAPGDSIAVNGVCLTVVDLDAAGTPGAFRADVMGETLRRSSLGALAPGDRVNLERPLALGARLGGHLVLGHVDGVGRILERQAAEHWETVRISLPPALARYVVEKGSIAVDGVSLTVAAVGGSHSPEFSVALIPTTLAATTLGRKGVGDPVNLEVDILAKHVEKLLERTGAAVVAAQGGAR
jgi:riboflavin synthase